MKHATLYFHYPCFDGLVSGALAWEFLKKRKNWDIRRFCPVDYAMRGVWLASELEKPCAIVDFLYHPGAAFWADHHQTSMLSPAAEADFQNRKDKGCLLFDSTARSCASLLFRRLRRFFDDKPHFREMVAWAEKIDSASYTSVEEAIFGDAPALQVNRSLSVAEKSEAKYARYLLQELRTHNLTYVAALDQVKRREKRVRESILKGLKTVGNRLRIEPGNVAFFDVQRKDDRIISRYAPYYFAPSARYSIAVIRSPQSIRITAMRNPWRKFHSISLGRVFARFGGGGHQRVGAVRLAANEHKRARDVVESLLSRMAHKTR
jgi:hypothetical protein